MTEFTISVNGNGESEDRAFRYDDATGKTYAVENGVELFWSISPYLCDAIGAVVGTLERHGYECKRVGACKVVA